MWYLWCYSTLGGNEHIAVIVSINKDVNAPIFKHSTYGIVADMFDVVPALTKALTGGEIPVVDMSKPEPKKAEATAPKTEEEKSPQLRVLRLLL